MNRSMRTRWYLLAALVLCALALYSLALATSSRQELTVTFLDVGQGDAVLIEGPTRAQVLVDAGRDARVLRPLAGALPWFDRSLDLVVATHPDADHIGGLPAVLERYEVSAVLENGAKSDTETARSLERAVQVEEALRFVATRGMRVDLGGGAILTILSPVRGEYYRDTNSASVVLLLRYGDTEFLLTGDAPSAVERALIVSYGSQLESEVLKAGHHGSRTSSDELFLKTVQPETVVVSVGNNSYGHPHEEVLTRLTTHGIKILRTDERGSITLVSDGKTISERSRANVYLP